MIDVIVIGAGPAGISAALYAIRSNLKVLIIYKDNGALGKAHSIDNYYGTGPVDGAMLQQKGLDNAIALGATTIKAEVLGLRLIDGFTVTTSEGIYISKTVIIATGSSRNAPNIPGIKEYTGKGISFCAICDGYFYRGKDVYVLGKDIYAMNEAQELTKNVNSVTILTNGEKVDQTIFKDYKIINKKIRALQGERRLKEIVFEDGEVIPTSGIFVAWGTAGAFSLAKKVGAETDNDKIVVNEKMETNIPGLLAAGDCTGGLYQVVKAAHEGAIAGLSASEYLRKKD